MAMELKQAIEITEKQTETSLMIQSRRDAFQQVLEAAKRYERLKVRPRLVWNIVYYDGKWGNAVNDVWYDTFDEAFDALYGRGE